MCKERHATSAKADFITFKETTKMVALNVFAWDSILLVASVITLGMKWVENISSNGLCKYVWVDLTGINSLYFGCYKLLQIFNISLLIFELIYSGFTNEFLLAY